MHDAGPFCFMLIGSLPPQAYSIINGVCRNWVARACQLCLDDGIIEEHSSEMESIRIFDLKHIDLPNGSVNCSDIIQGWNVEDMF